MEKAASIDRLNNLLEKLNNLHSSFDYIKLTIASPERIKSWAEKLLPNGQIIGEVSKPDTLNFRTLQPENEGLFCERIFGPINDWQCKCLRYQGIMPNKICENCQVELIESRVRRYRMGTIELVYPVAHYWYFNGNSNYLYFVLSSEYSINKNYINNVLYFETEFNEKNPLFKYVYPKILNNRLFQNFNFSDVMGRKRLGAELLKIAIENIDLNIKIKEERMLLFDKEINIKRLRILESFVSSKTKPEWMFLTSLPVLPPALRPLLELDDGTFLNSDLNDIYRLILIRNQRLSDFTREISLPDVIAAQSRKHLQEVVDALIDNAKLPKNKVLMANDRPLKGLTSLLEGKFGRFRHYLLGKRVDFSGRSVITVGPLLRLNQCGLPFDIAIELFKPFLIRELFSKKIKALTKNINFISKFISFQTPFIWSLLEKITKENVILLNRAPTLHKFGIQAFYPVLILGHAIQLHPLVCTGFNADFDGDQMAVHLPLYNISQLESKMLMQSCFNILSPTMGDVLLKPTQDMVIGCYYLTLMSSYITLSKFVKYYSSEEEALTAFYQKKLSLHSKILIHYNIEDFCVFLKENMLTILKRNFTNYNLFEHQIFIKKVYKSSRMNERLFLITNLGIIVCSKLINKYYKPEYILIETTPGRLIFSNNIINIIK